MEYYGFDGYFINQEEAIPEEYVPRLKEVMKYMMDRGAYIQWYDSLTNAGTISYQNAFNEMGSDFVYDTKHGLGQVSHSMFLNYWYDAGAIEASAKHAESLGLDPYEAVYMGLEGGEWRFGIDLESFWDIMYNHDSYAGNLMQENGQPWTSLAIWGSDFYREQYNKVDNDRYKVEYQWEADERERMYFTSPAENVKETTRLPTSAARIWASPMSPHSTRTATSSTAPSSAPRPTSRASPATSWRSPSSAAMSSPPTSTPATA